MQYLPVNVSFKFPTPIPRTVPALTWGCHCYAAVRLVDRNWQLSHVYFGNVGNSSKGVIKIAQQLYKLIQLATKYMFILATLSNPSDMVKDRSIVVQIYVTFFSSNIIIFWQRCVLRIFTQHCNLHIRWTNTCAFIHTLDKQMHNSNFSNNFLCNVLTQCRPTGYRPTTPNPKVRGGRPVASTEGK